MTTYTHADLSAAIDKARWDESGIPPRLRRQGWEQHNAHLDTLAAVLDLHQPTPVQSVCPWCVGYDSYNVDWPCPTAQTVADALRRMGALPEATR